MRRTKTGIKEPVSSEPDTGISGSWDNVELEPFEPDSYLLPEPTRQGQGNGKKGIDLNLLVSQVIAKDNPVQAYNLAEPLSHVSLTEYVGYKSQLKEHFKQRLSISDLDGAVKDIRKSRKFAAIAVKRNGEQGRTTVEVGGQLRDVVQSSLNALVHADEKEPSLFVRGSELVTIHFTKDKVPLIAPFSEQSLRLRMSHSADYISVRTTSEDVQMLPVDPPLDIVRAILSGMNPYDYPFPSLVGITELPILRNDGTLHATPGYDAKTEQVYIPGELIIPPVPDIPTTEDVQQAKDILNFWLADFPFENEASRATILADAITVVIRSAIDDQVPLTLLDAPKQGTGKTLIAQVIGILGAGRTPPSNAPVNDEEEWGKKILMWLQDSPSVVIIDNITQRLASNTLNCAITAPTIDGRRLGTNEHMTVANHAIWFATGNNIRVDDDTARRCITCRLDARVERPHLRGIKKFRIPGGVKGYRKWTEKHRAELVAAILVLAKNWYAQGQPIPDVTPLGNFEEWTTIVGGILQCAGIPGFLANLNTEDGTSSLDDVSAEWAAFSEAIHTVYQDTPFTCSELVKNMLSKDEQSENLLCETLPSTLTKHLDNYRKSQGENMEFATHIGNAFRTRKGQIHGDFCLEVAGKDRKNRVQWKVSKHEMVAVQQWFTAFNARPSCFLTIGEKGEIVVNAPQEVLNQEETELLTYVTTHHDMLYPLVQAQKIPEQKSTQEVF